MIEQLKTYYQGLMAKHALNINVYLNNPVGVGEHPDIVEAIDMELTAYIDAQDKYNALGSINSAAEEQ